MVPPFATFSDSSADRFHRWDQACRFVIATEKKSDDIWSDFLKDAGPSKKPKKVVGGGLGSLSSISKPKKSTGNENKTKSKSKTKSAKSSIDSLFDTFESGNKIEDVIEKPPEKIPEQPKSLMSSIFEAVKNKTGKAVEGLGTN